MIDSVFNFDDDDSLDEAVRNEMDVFGFKGEDFVMGTAEVHLGKGKNIDFVSFQKLVHEMSLSMVKSFSAFLSSLLPAKFSVVEKNRIMSCSDKELKFELSFNFPGFIELDGALSLNSYQELFKENEHVLFAVLSSVARCMNLTFESVRASLFTPNVTVCFVSFNDSARLKGSERKEIPDVTVSDLLSLATFDDTRALNRYDDPLASLMEDED